MKLVVLNGWTRGTQMFLNLWELVNFLFIFYSWLPPFYGYAAHNIHSFHCLHTVNLLSSFFIVYIWMNRPHRAYLARRYPGWSECQKMCCWWSRLPCRHWGRPRGFWDLFMMTITDEENAETLKVMAKDTSCQHIYKTMSTLSQSPLKTRAEDEANFQTPPNPCVITYLTVFIDLFNRDTLIHTVVNVSELISQYIWWHNTDYSIIDPVIQFIFPDLFDHKILMSLTVDMALVQYTTTTIFTAVEHYRLGLTSRLLFDFESMEHHTNHSTQRLFLHPRAHGH